MMYTPIIWSQYSRSAKVLDPCKSLEDALSDLRSEGIDTSENVGSSVCSHQRYAEVEVEHDNAFDMHPIVTTLYYKSI
jgi:hypothetical protein